METDDDVTVRKRADAELRESERRYRNIFRTAGVSIWEDDFSQVQSALDDLKARGVRDFAQHFTAHPEFVRQAITMVRVVNVKPLLPHQLQRDGNGIVDLPFDHRGAWGTNMGIAQRWAGYDLCVRPSVRTGGGVVIALPSPRCQGVLSEGCLVLVDRAAAWIRGDVHVGAAVGAALPAAEDDCRS